MKLPVIQKKKRNYQKKTDSNEIASYQNEITGRRLTVMKLPVIKTKLPGEG
jgi:hypothetical protein